MIQVIDPAGIAKRTGAGYKKRREAEGKAAAYIRVSTARLPPLSMARGGGGREASRHVVEFREIAHRYAGTTALH